MNLCLRQMRRPTSVPWLAGSFISVIALPYDPTITIIAVPYLRPKHRAAFSAEELARQIGIAIGGEIAFLSALHFKLNLIPCRRVNDGRMTVFDVVLRYLSLIDLHLFL